MRKLAEFVGGRENNFNLLRFVAAFLVLFSHSFALSTGNPHSEPLRDLLGMTPGSIAVDIFFVASGFLVTGSLMTSGSVGRFLLARALRIYPALWMAVVATTVVVGLFFSSWSVGRFAGSFWTWEHVARNATLLFGVSYQLPGAFEAAPAAGAVNGSLWTLPIEIRMYGALALLWIAARTLRFSSDPSFGRLLGVAAAVAFVGSLVTHGTELGVDVGLAYMFFAGAAMYAARDRIRLSWVLFVGAVLALAISVLWHQAFFVVYELTVPYLVIFVAYMPKGKIRRFNRLGDYSYGIYIYAFPLQQMTMSLLPGIGQLALLGISSAATLLLAVASWHLVESRALALKNRRWMPVGSREA